jgi:hypothetical protein
MSRVPLFAPSSAALIAIALLAGGCSSLAKKEAQVFPAGEKVTVGPLIYSVIDSQVLTQLGDDPATARTPKNRFHLMAIIVSNSSSEDVAIPGLTLVDDSGKEYPELADGANVPNWLGVVRRAAAAQTEQGNVLFDAPAQHFRLRLTDDTDAKELSIDVPLNYVNEQLKDLAPPASQVGPQPLAIPQKK